MERLRPPGKQTLSQKLSPFESMAEKMEAYPYTLKAFYLF